MIRLLAPLLFLLAAAPVAAQTLPKSMRIIVPYSAGGSSDFVARTVAERLGPLVGTSVLVEARPGGNTVIGTEAVVKSPPDGSMLLLVGIQTYAAQPHLMKSMPYDVARDLTPINNVIISPLVLSVNPNVPAKNVKELVDYARANPGKVNFGSAGVGNTLHLAVSQFIARTGVKIVDVPYKGASQAVVDLIAGNIHMMIDLVTTPLPHIQSGRLRALATTWEKRASALPNVPTMIEQGVDMNFGSMIGLMGPANMPRDLVARLHADIAKVMAMPEVKDAFAKQAMEPLTFPTPDAYKATFLAEIESMGKLVKAAGIQPQ